MTLFEFNNLCGCKLDEASFEPVNSAYMNSSFNQVDFAEAFKPLLKLEETRKLLFDIAKSAEKSEDALFKLQKESDEYADEAAAREHDLRNRYETEITDLRCEMQIAKAKAEALEAENSRLVSVLVDTLEELKRLRKS